MAIDNSNPKDLCRQAHALANAFDVLLMHGENEIAFKVSRVRERLKEEAVKKEKEAVYSDILSGIE